MPRLPRLLRFGCQNVRSLLDLSNAGAGAPPRRSAVCDDEFSRVQTEVIALSESRLPNKGSLVESNYTFFWSGQGLLTLRGLETRKNLCRDPRFA